MILDNTIGEESETLRFIRFEIEVSQRMYNSTFLFVSNASGLRFVNRFLKTVTTIVLAHNFRPSKLIRSKRIRIFAPETLLEQGCLA